MKKDYNKIYALLATEEYLYYEDGEMRTGAQLDTYIDGVFRTSFEAEMFLRGQIENGAYGPNKKEGLWVSGEIIEICLSAPIKVNRNSKWRIWNFLDHFFDESNLSEYWRNGNIAIEPYIKRIDCYKLGFYNNELYHSNYHLYDDEDWRRYNDIVPWYNRY